MAAGSRPAWTWTRTAHPVMETYTQPQAHASAPVTSTSDALDLSGGLLHIRADSSSSTPASTFSSPLSSTSTSTRRSSTRTTSSQTTTSTPSSSGTEAVTHTRTPVAVIAGTLAGVIVLITIGLTLAIVRKKQTKRRKAMRMLRRRMQLDGDGHGGAGGAERVNDDDVEEGDDGEEEGEEGIDEIIHTKASYHDHPPHSLPTFQKNSSARSDSGRHPRQHRRQHTSTSSSSGSSASGAGSTARTSNSKSKTGSRARRIDPSTGPLIAIPPSPSPPPPSPIPKLPTIVVTDEPSRRRSTTPSLSPSKKKEHDAHSDIGTCSSSSGNTFNTLDTTLLGNNTVSSTSISEGSIPPSPSPTPSLCPSLSPSSRSHSPRNSTSSAHGPSPRIPSPVHAYHRPSQSKVQAQDAYTYPAPSLLSSLAPTHHGTSSSLPLPPTSNSNLSYPPSAPASALSPLPPPPQSVNTKGNGKALLELQAQIAALKRENAQLRGLDPSTASGELELEAMGMEGEQPPSYQDAAAS